MNMTLQKTKNKKIERQSMYYAKNAKKYEKN